MSVAICDDRSMCEAVLTREVVVMEDSQPAEEALKEVIEGELGWKVTMAKNSKEVADYAQNKKGGIYILDNKIGDNPTEGLAALEKIKDIDENIPVAIFSAYPTYKDRAYKINNNLVIYEVKQSGTRLKENVQHIITKILERLQEIFDEMQSKAEKSNDECRNMTLAFIGKEKSQLEKDRKKLEEAFAKQPDSKVISDDKKSDSVLLDRNFEAYEQRKSDGEWLRNYEGKYVAFVDGEQVFPEITDEQELLKLIRGKYPKQRRFFTKVETEDTDVTIDLPSSLDIFYPIG